MNEAERQAWNDTVASHSDLLAEIVSLRAERDEWRRKWSKADQAENYQIAKLMRAEAASCGTQRGYAQQIRELADAARAEALKAAPDPDDAKQSAYFAYYMGVEDALLHLAGDVTSERIAALAARTSR